jgi:hypothetical protein
MPWWVISRIRCSEARELRVKKKNTPSERAEKIVAPKVR